MQRRLACALAIAIAACGEPRARPPTTSPPVDDTPRPVASPNPAPGDAAADGDAPDPADVRPPDVVIAAPPGFVAPSATAPPEPAAHGWWKKKTGCGKGRRMVKHDLRDAHRSTFDPEVGYSCRDTAGKDDGPYVALYADGTVYEEGTMDHGVEHGVRKSYAPDGRLSLSTPWVHGVEDGVVREDTGTVRKEQTYRTGTRHGLQREEWYATPRYTIQGYKVDGENHGVWWTTWHDGSVLARIEYDHGKVVGAPRWWYPDGRVWARAAIAGDTITWTSDVGPGRYHAELACRAGQRERFVVRDRDRTGTVLHAHCTDGSCTPVQGDRELLAWAHPSDCPPGAFLRVRVWPVLAHWGE
jgi:antitoxin component YwqK of YwqJK toxin-antitoxin module